MTPFDLARLRLDDRFVRELPGDPSRAPGVRRVEGACWSYARPVAPPAPRLLACAEAVADLLGFDADACRTPGFLDLVSGRALPPGAAPYAACYGGHQFGQWAGQLGDGRAIALGERAGVDGVAYTLQLKGAGPTPYARRGDGFAVLRSSVREYLCSEAMAHLGVPTTRALSLVATGAAVVRDPFYDGRPAPEPGAIVCRVAPSFLRFGSFELPAARGDLETLRALLDATLRERFPACGEPGPDAYAALFAEVCRRTARLIAAWERVGFVHGVMNTDNLSILGLTIDYGPYGWLDAYDPDWTPNTSDAHGRYRFGAQADAAAWNLARLAGALLPLVGAPAPLEAGLDVYLRAYAADAATVAAGKLGLAGADAETVAALDAGLRERFAADETDMTIFYRRLGAVTAAAGGADDAAVSDAAALDGLAAAFYDPAAARGARGEAWTTWLRAYRSALAAPGRPDDAARRRAMEAVNPAYVLRNYLAQAAAERAAEGDMTELEALAAALRSPYVERPEAERFAARRPEWARKRPGSSTLSCSS